MVKQLWHYLFGHPAKFVKHFASFHHTGYGCDIFGGYELLLLNYTKLMGCEECGAVFNEVADFAIAKAKKK